MRSSFPLVVSRDVLPATTIGEATVFVPEEVGCCAFAGDKGFTHPELNAWALRKLRGQIEHHGVQRGFSNSRTCEIGLTTHSGVPYRSLIYLIDEVTNKKK